MAWCVALVLDAETDLGVIVSRMPVWAQITEKRSSHSLEVRKQWDAMWYPEPSVTLITTPLADDLDATAAGLLPVLAEHHPNLYCIHLRGVLRSESLIATMSDAGYRIMDDSNNGVLVFARPLEDSALELIFDASDWDLTASSKMLENFYNAFFSAVGAPNWHGRNFNALNDSIAAGGINEIEVPYKIVVRHARKSDGIVPSAFDDLSSFFVDLQAVGCPVALILESKWRVASPDAADAKLVE